MRFILKDIAQSLMNLEELFKFMIQPNAKTYFQIVMMNIVLWMLTNVCMLILKIL